MAPFSKEWLHINLLFMFGNKYFLNYEINLIYIKVLGKH